jgi:hypothetical protein
MTSDELTTVGVESCPGSPETTCTAVASGRPSCVRVVRPLRLRRSRHGCFRKDANVDSRAVVAGLRGIAGPSWDQLDDAVCAMAHTPIPSFSGGSAIPAAAPHVEVRAVARIVESPPLPIARHRVRTTYPHKLSVTPTRCASRSSSMRLPRPVRQRRRVRRVAGPRRARAPGRRSAAPHDLARRCAA